MATRAVLTELDTRHRRQQADVAARVARLIAGYWLSLDPDDVLGTGGDWLNRSVEAVQAGRRSSALLASSYAEAVRRLQVPRAPALQRPTVPDVPVEKLRRSLAFTGLKTAQVNLGKIPDLLEPEQGESPDLAALRSSTRDERRRAAMIGARDAALASAVKLVADGGRDMSEAVIRSDRVALGYFRVTQSDNPCGFCLALASRGPVYVKGSFARSNAKFADDPRATALGDQKVHDRCLCQLRPVYTDSDEEWSDQALAADALWASSTVGFSGKAAMNAFRRAARDAGLADANRW